MNWQQISLRLDAREAPRAEALLRLAGADCVSYGRASGGALFEPLPGETPLWTEVQMCGLFPPGVDVAALARVLSGALSSTARLQIAPLSESWRDKAQPSFLPRRVGRRLWLVPADHSGADQLGGDDSQTRIRLHMGLAFGTGEHATTRLCLEALEARVVSGRDVLDYGCGSGVLAIAALALGARRAWAVDIDPQALTATADNAALNDIGGALWIGLPTELPALAVDLVVANILARPLAQLAAEFHRRLARGGRIVLSGVLAEQCCAVRAAYRPYFADFQTETCEGWARIEARRMT